MTVCPDLIAWGERIAVREAKRFRLVGQERDDLKSAAVLKIVELAARSVADGGFDPSRVPEGGVLLEQWKAWADLHVHCECRREALRLRNGGTFHTARPENVVQADPLGDSAEALEAAEPVPTPTTVDGSTGARLVDVKPVRRGRSFAGAGVATGRGRELLQRLTQRV